VNPVDLTRIRTVPLSERTNKVDLSRFARPGEPGRSFVDFVDGLPQMLAGSDIRAIVEAVVRARRGSRPVIMGIGAHVIKCGLGPIVIDLMKRGIVTALALNGSGAIHDLELALVGGTSEDVAAGMHDGTFGMARETGELFNRSVAQLRQQPELGMGALLADGMLEADVPFKEQSLLVWGRRLGVPTTVHVAIGTDIVHMHPSADGGAIGQASFNDFRLFAGLATELSGGVYFNIGSAVILPEVFLKAFTIAQNVGAELREFVTVNMDMLTHYRSIENVVRRPPQARGSGYCLIGRHEIMLPLLAQAVIERLEGRSNSASSDAPRSNLAKLVGWDELLQERQEWRRQGRSVVWTNGCFDILHVGHVRGLRAARGLGDVLIVGINSDESVRRIKGPTRPIIPQCERAEILAELECVDRVVVFDESTPEAALRRLEPDVHCKGADYAPPGGKPIPEAAVVAAYGGRIEFLALTPDISTTSILGRMMAAPSQPALAE
jgi:rfaE bifunctional protein nucleotidyltransferase chain/domain